MALRPGRLNSGCAAEAVYALQRRQGALQRPPADLSASSRRQRRDVSVNVLQRPADLGLDVSAASDLGASSSSRRDDGKSPAATARLQAGLRSEQRAALHDAGTVQVARESLAGAAQAESSLLHSVMANESAQADSLVNGVQML